MIHVNFDHFRALVSFRIGTSDKFFLFYPSYFWAILKETRSVIAKRVIDEEKFLGILISVWFFFPDFSMVGFCPKNFRSWGVELCRLSLLLCTKTQFLLKLNFYTSQPVVVSCRKVLVISNILFHSSFVWLVTQFLTEVTSKNCVTTHKVTNKRCVTTRVTAPK